MADAMTLEAPASVAPQGTPETGKPQGEQPKLSPLYDQLPEAARKSIKAERFSSLAKLENLVAEIDRLDGEVGKGIRVPGKDATKEQVAQYRKELGIPSGPEGYSLTKPNNLPNGLPYNDQLEKWFRTELFEAGVPQSHAEKMFTDWNAMQSQAYVALQKRAEEQRTTFAKQAIETLQAEYKDNYGEAMQSMKAALARFGGTKTLELISQARMPNGLTLDNHPDFVRMFVEVGRRMDADKMVSGDTTSAGADTSRPGLPMNPVTGQPMPQFYPHMEKDPRLRVKAE